jgi:two-component system NtrC family response regulator
MVLTDIRMPGRDGMEVLRQIRGARKRPPVPVVILTAYGTVEQAVEAMKLGAHTYLLKPFNRDELALTVEQALRNQTLERDNRNLRRLLRQKSEELPVIFASEEMEQLIGQVRQVADTDVTVLITGESGTGKELIARAVHDLSQRWDKPFVAVNCSALPAELVESELFGHAKGAFTGADQPAAGRIRSSAGGTLFLDEIGELPLALQPKLLRVLETKMVDPVGGPEPVQVDFRLLCATNKNLKAEVDGGRFREDLFYRLEVLTLAVPPLRDRLADISLLWEHFTHLHGGEGVRSTPELLRRLERMPWRGNVRELKNLNQRLLLMRPGDRLTEADLEATLSRGILETEEFVPGTGAMGELPLGALPEEGFSLHDLEKEIIRRALAKFGGNKSRTASYLRIPRHVLVYRIEKYDL